MIAVIFFFIHFLGTLPYAARVVGVRTKMLALSFTLFNIIALIARTIQGFQTPYLAKYMETNLPTTPAWTPLPFFYWLIGISVVGCIAGIFFLPATTRIFTKGVGHYYRSRSLKRVILMAFTKKGLSFFFSSLSFQPMRAIGFLFPFKHLPLRLFIYHVIATACVTVGPLSAIYAGYLHPEFRSTASSLAFIINGIAVLIMFLLIDPPLAAMTEDTVQGKMEEPFFSRCLAWFVVARVFGTALAAVLLLPFAKLVAVLALIM